MPHKPKLSQPKAIELSADDLADIARARSGMPLPPALAHKLAEIVAAALRGDRVEVVQAAETPEAKQDATLSARAALAGFELVRQADSTWLASRWGQFRTLADDEEVERFLNIVGAPA
ncbi:MAG: hypothetical protein JO006_03505 [Paucibacter sp.]|nr:hypothetical protein [Roseateles sp.]